MDEDQVLAGDKYLVAKSSLPLHCRPCLKSPLRSFLQYWHTVGRVYQWMTNVCGTLTLDSKILSSWMGRPMYDWEFDLFSRPMKDSDGDFCYTFERQQGTISCKRLIYICMHFYFHFDLIFQQKGSHYYWAKAPVQKKLTQREKSFSQ